MGEAGRRLVLRERSALRRTRSVGRRELGTTERRTKEQRRERVQ